MTKPNSILAQLEELAREGKLGVLGGSVIVIAYALSEIGDEQTTQEQVLEDLKIGTMCIEFGRYGSSIEKKIAKETEGFFKPRNFTLYFSVEGSKIRNGVAQYPSHFRWDGSREGLDDEMRKDVEILRNLGFEKVDYKGHNSKKDISF